MKILLVDDADVFRQSVANLLRSRGHEVIEAANGLDGVKLARTHLPDVVVSDIVMSQVDGYAMTGVLRQHPTTADIPLVLITGEADLKGMRKGMTLGADDYIAKPFKMDELVASLELRVNRRRALRADVEQKLACLGAGIGLKLPAELSGPLQELQEVARSLGAEGATRAPWELAGMAQTISVAGQRIQRRIDNLFLHAQLELFGTNPMHLDGLRHGFTEDAAALVSTAATQYSTEAGRIKDLQLKLAPGSVAMAGLHFAKLVEELLRNAFQYSPLHTPVTVQCYNDGHDFLLTVTDRGRGMSAEQLADLTQPAKAAAEPRVSGLGLPIARRLAELHGGKLILTSESGKGTTARVSLPARPIDAPTAASISPP